MINTISYKKIILIITSLILFILGVTLLLFKNSLLYGRQIDSNNKLITVHDRNEVTSFITKTSTLKEAFKEYGIKISEQDLVEPKIDEKLITNNYQVNIYRARPVLVVDGETSKKILSPYQTAEQIVENANLSLRAEDETKIGPISDVITNGPGIQVNINRALKINLVLYGKQADVYTQKNTVNEFLNDKNIKINPDDTLSVSRDLAITDGMTIEIWRNGKQTISEEEDIDFSIKQIKDADQKAGYRVVQSPGKKGKRLVTYEVEMKNGVEISRTKIQSVDTTLPVEQVEIVGSKVSFDGDFAQALAKLRSCEGGYNSWNPAGPYYGAYQFNQSTWNSVTSAPYGNASPAEQDEAARRLYERRGWQPWPVCGASLPDIYR